MRREQRQYENGDWGVACVAMITGESYEEVESAFHENGLVIDDGQYFTLHKDLITILKSFAYEAVRRRFSSWDAVELPAIVKINVRSAPRIGGRGLCAGPEKGHACAPGDRLAVGVTDAGGGCLGVLSSA